MLHEPTQAVDVGARSDIIDAIREAARDGCGVLISSVDAADLAVLCDRVLVFRDGRRLETQRDRGGSLMSNALRSVRKEWPLRGSSADVGT